MSVLAGIAVKAFDFMMKTYDRKYGKYGEKVVKKLKRELVRTRIIAEQQGQEIKDLREQLIDEKKLIVEMRKARAELRRNYKELIATTDENARERILAQPNPYGEDDVGGDDDEID